MSDERIEYNFNPIDTELDTAVGIGLPFAGNKTFFHLNYTTEEQAIDNFKNLILTRKGERFMQPQFGWSGWNLLFDQDTPDIIEKLKLSFQSDVSYWLPYIMIEETKIKKMKEFNGHGILIELILRVKPSLTSKTITLELSSQGGITILEG